jgi:hypothetical protein
MSLPTGVTVQGFRCKIMAVLAGLVAMLLGAMTSPRNHE